MTTMGGINYHGLKFEGQCKRAIRYNDISCLSRGILDFLQAVMIGLAVENLHSSQNVFSFI